VGALFRQLMVALFINHLLPIRLGEAARMYLSHQAGVPMPTAVASVVLARAIDLGSLALLVCVGGLLLSAAVTWSHAAAAMAIAWLALAGLWFLLWPRLAVAPRAAAPRPCGLRRALARAADCARPRQLLVATCLTLPSWLLEASVLWTVMRALGHPISPLASVAVTAAVLLGQVIHLTPGGVGTYELTMATALVVLGQPGRVALSAAVLAHGFKFAYAYAVGAGALWWEMRQGRGRVSGATSMRLWVLDVARKGLASLRRSRRLAMGARPN
ncbi:MAG: YbhN family protein, partial [Nitrospinota bacterium]